MTGQPSLGTQFDALWPEFEGQRVTKVIMTFAGEVDLSQNPDLCAALSYLGEVEFTIHGRITGKKHSYVKGATVGNATLAVERVELGNTSFLTTKAQTAAARAAKEAERPAQRDPLEVCGQIHEGHLSACQIPWQDCEIGLNDPDRPRPNEAPDVIAQATEIARNASDRPRRGRKPKAE